MAEPPVSLRLRGRQVRKEPVRIVDLTLHASGWEQPRWILLPLRLDEPLRDAFVASVISVCEYATAADVRCVEALGASAGFVGFRLGPGARLSLARYELTGEPDALEVGTAGAVEVGGAPLAATVHDRVLLEGAHAVPDAFRRRTRRTLAHQEVPVRLDDLERWSLAL